MDHDTYLLKVLSRSKLKEEAMAWLKKPDGKPRMLGDEADAEGSLRFVQDLYQRGAVEVTAIDIHADSLSEETNTLIVKLPSEKAARKKLFEVEARVARLEGYDPVADDGQRYLMLHW